MNDALKNPFLVLIAGLIGIWLIFKVLGVIIAFSGLFVLAFIILFIINPRFRGIIQRFLAGLFNS